MKKILLVLLLLQSMGALPQDGSIDPTFNTGLGADQNVYITKQLSSGKIIVGGQFMDYGETGRRNLVQLHADGSIDPTFISPPDIENFALLSDAIEDNGKLVVVGQFGMFSGLMSPGIVRLNSDGSADPTFAVGTGITGSIYGLLNLSKQGDKYIVSGDFSGFNGIQCGNIIRLNQDGTLDETFTSVSDDFCNATITAHQILPDGKIMIVGNFACHNNVPRNGIARLEANGAIDLSFDPGTGVNGTIGSIAVQPDGKYIIGGPFSRYNETEKLLLARINPDGTLDNTFSKSPQYRTSASTLLIQPDGKIIATGFLTGMSTFDEYVVRLQTNGAIDPGFDSDIDNVVNVASFQDDGKILVGGWFENTGALQLNRVARLQNDGFLATKQFYSDATIYPNPVAGVTHIGFGREEDYTLTVLDLLGKPLQQFSGNANAATVDFSNYPIGIYLLKIETSDGTAIKKILKK